MRTSCVCRFSFITFADCGRVDCVNDFSGVSARYTYNANYITYAKSIRPTTHTQKGGHDEAAQTVFLNESPGQ